MKDKKITIKPFLNTQLGTIGSSTDEKSTKKIYPLYYKITYNRKSTQFKSTYAMPGYECLEAIDKQLISFESKILKEIIVFETAKQEVDYSLIGLKKKFEVYSLSIDFVLEDYLRKSLQRSVMQLNHPFKYVIDFRNYSLGNSITIIYEACKLLFPSLDSHLHKSFSCLIESYEVYLSEFNLQTFSYDFPTLIDWFNNTSKNAFYLRLLKKVSKVKANEILDSIDIILKNRLNNMISNPNL